MQNRIGWTMGVLAAVALLAAISVGVTGYRSAPVERRAAHPAPAEPRPEAADPLAPRFLDSGGSVRVHVAGAVKKPGVYTLPAWARVIDAVQKARGFREDADPDAINLADPIRDGEQIRIPVRGRTLPLQRHAPTPEPPPVPATVGGRGLGRYPFAPAPAGRVDLNTASPEELDALPGIGPATAQRIVDYRREHGPFLRPEDLMDVPGIGPARFERLRERITVR